MATVHHRYVTVPGQWLFHQEAGPADAPAVDTPSAGESDYSFDLLANITLDLLDQINVQMFAMYIQDHGAPAGRRLALANPAAVTAIVSRNGNAYDVDYATNVALYPRVHDHLRDSGVPVLAIWGRNDESFRPGGALAFADDSPGVQIRLLDGGHFLLESHLDVAADTIRHLLDQVGA